MKYLPKKKKCFVFLLNASSSIIFSLSVALTFSVFFASLLTISPENNKGKIFAIQQWGAFFISASTSFMVAFPFLKASLFLSNKAFEIEMGEVDLRIAQLSNREEAQS